MDHKGQYRPDTGLTGSLYIMALLPKLGPNVKFAY